MEPQVGDIIKILWNVNEEEDGGQQQQQQQEQEEQQEEEHIVKIINKMECNKIKHKSKYKYNLLFNNNKIRTTRLLHKQFHIITRTGVVNDNGDGEKVCEKLDDNNILTTTKKKKSKKMNGDKKVCEKLDDENILSSNKKKKKKRKVNELNSNENDIKLNDSHDHSDIDDKTKKKRKKKKINDDDNSTIKEKKKDKNKNKESLNLVNNCCIKEDKRGRDIPPHRTILAPMVGGSELAFRLLCRRYGAGELTLQELKLLLLLI